MTKFSWLLVFIGRPNAGKSSLIRKLTILNPQIGKKPGTTRKIIEYPLANQFTVVDAPGWGKIHNRSKDFQDSVKDEIIDFLETNHERIVTCILTIDISTLVEVSERLSKKGIISIDQELFAFLKELKVKIVVALNKLDKIPRESANQAIAYFKELLNYPKLDKSMQDEIILVSAKTGENLPLLRDRIRQNLHEKGIEEFERYIKLR